uniref:Uncharacterized protein n=1 Tax=Rhipicephalus appendiculatus TaxID=34631 RepID=A0A131YB10_RHIAP
MHSHQSRMGKTRKAHNCSEELPGMKLISPSGNKLNRSSLFSMLIFMSSNTGRPPHVCPSCRLDGTKLLLLSHLPMLNHSGPPRGCPVLLGRRCITLTNLKWA